MRPPMFHLRFARSFLRFAAKAPYCTPSLRLPKRCTTHRDVGGVPPQIPEHVAKRRKGAFAPSLRFTPIALRLRLRATERRQAAPDVPPASREDDPEARGESAVQHPIPEVAEAQHLTEALGCERVGSDGVAHAGGARRGQARGDDDAVGQGEVLGVAP